MAPKLAMAVSLAVALLLSAGCGAEDDGAAQESSPSTAPTGRSEELDLVLPTISDSELAACDVDAAERERLMGLSPDEFDQDLSGGWRAVAMLPDCELVAASLLGGYISRHGIEPSDGVMHWHVGQLLAGAGQHGAAIPWIEVSRSGDLEWDLYVDGTSAFLAGDRPALEAAVESLGMVEVSEEEKALRRQALADEPDLAVRDGFVDEPQNLGVLNGFLTCFDEPYRVAYGCE